MIELAEKALRVGLKLGATDVGVLVEKEKFNMVRFSNNEVTLVESDELTELTVYLSKGGRRFLASTSNVEAGGIEEFVNRAYESCLRLPKSEEYAPLPSGVFSYPKNPNYDPRIDEEEFIFSSVESAINSGLEEGGERVAGSLHTVIREIALRTSGGIEASDRSSYVMLNVRALAGEASGHGLSCSSGVKGFDPEGAGRTAGRYCRLSKKTGKLEDGVYNLVLSPTVAADLMQHVGYSASAYDFDLGLSFLCGRLGSKVAPDGFGLYDHGVIEGGLNSRSFDDEGVPTSSTPIIEDGVLKGLLHNSTTAKKHKVKSTGNAGIIVPHPWNLVVREGDMEFEELIGEAKRGLLLTNNWYTRFQDYREGSFSTLPRDATLYFEDGEIKYAVKGIRVSDKMPRLLSNIKGVGKNRVWVLWWEVETPVLSPYLLVEGCRITTV
ncbi:MAG: TldD/PmbA family protein [Thaumarchaeota archaeon]|nr:TldD/PmbA family protein [Nitrososphaerota archaeon]